MITPTKRKAPEDLSNNPHTVKVRKRNERIGSDAIKAQVEKAKNADRAAVTYAKKKLKKTPSYLVADKATQAQMLDEVADDVMIQRTRDGKDAATLQASLGLGKVGGFYAVEDDGNPVWEDIDYESDEDLEFEQRWRDDEKRNGDVFMKGQEVESQEVDDMSPMLLANKLANKHRLLAFFTWQKKWNGARKSLFRKLKRLGSSVEQLDRVVNPVLDKNGFKRWAPPSKFFTQSEKAVWRNLAVWTFDEWVPLPGPAEWWPDDSKAIDDLGFWFSQSDYGHQKAMKIVTGDEPDADLYLFAYPGSDDLRLLPDTPENRAWLDAFHTQNF